MKGPRNNRGLFHLMSRPEIVLPAWSDKGGNHIGSMLKTQLKQAMEQVICNNLLICIHTLLINLDFRERLGRYLLSHRTGQDAE